MRLIHSLVAAAAACLTATAFAAPQVDVAFSDSLQKIMPRLDQAERRSEADFRKTGDPASRYGTVDLAARAQARHVAFAGAALIPNISNYSVAKFVQRLAEESLVRSGLPDAHISLTINRVAAANHPVAVIGGNTTFVKGLITVRDAAGSSVRSFPIVAHNVTHFSTGSSKFEGDFQFSELEETSRVGPVLSDFVRKALTQAFPDRQFPAPTLVSLGAGRRVIQKDF